MQLIAQLKYNKNIAHIGHKCQQFYVAHMELLKNEKEGLGEDMVKSGCKNAKLFFTEP